MFLQFLKAKKSALFRCTEMRFFPLNSPEVIVQEKRWKYGSCGKPQFSKAWILSEFNFEQTPWRQTVLTIQWRNLLFIVDLVPHHIFPYLEEGFSLGNNVAVKRGKKKTITLLGMGHIKTVMWIPSEISWTIQNIYFFDYSDLCIMDKKCY